MTIDQIAEAAEEKIQAAYWTECDKHKAAVDPEEITTIEWARDLLGGSYEIALRIEADPHGWSEGRAK